GLACAKRGPTATADPHRNGSNVDDPTVTSPAHQQLHYPAAIERTLNTHRADSLPVVDRMLPQLCVRPTNSTVVDEYVDRRDDPERLLHGIRHRSQVAHVCGYARSAQLLPGSVRCLAVEVPNDDLRSRCDKALGYG